MPLSGPAPKNELPALILCLTLSVALMGATITNVLGAKAGERAAALDSANAPLVLDAAAGLDAAATTMTGHNSTATADIALRQRRGACADASCTPLDEWRRSMQPSSVTARYLDDDAPSLAA